MKLHFHAPIGAHVYLSINISSNQIRMFNIFRMFIILRVNIPGIPANRIKHSYSSKDYETPFKHGIVVFKDYENC